MSDRTVTPDSKGLVMRHDTVKHPDHYNWHPATECITVTQHFGFNLGNVIKYVWRAASPNERPESKRVEDLRKAAQYIEFEISKLVGSGNDTYDVYVGASNTPIRTVEVEPVCENPECDGPCTPGGEGGSVITAMPGWVSLNRCGDAEAHAAHKYGAGLSYWCDGYR